MGMSETVGQSFLVTARKFGAGHVCMIERRKEGWYEYTWAEVETIVRELAMGLLELNVKHGDRVAIMADTAPQWTWIDLAVAMIGGVVATIYPTNTPAQMAYILKDSGSSLLAVAGSSELASFAEIRDQLPKVRQIICFDAAAAPPDETVISLEKLRELGRNSARQDELDQRIRAVSGDDLFTLIYTSGTTGDPKGVMLSHRNLISNVNSSLEIFPIIDRDVGLSFLPLSHSLERMAGSHLMMRAGVPVAFAEDISRLVQNMQEVRPTVMVAVPRIYEKMYARIIDSVEKGSDLKKKMFQWALKVGKQVSALKLAKRQLPLGLRMQYAIAHKLVFSKLAERMGGRLKYFISGGAPLAQELAEFFHAAGILICEGYGLTETSPVLTVNTPEDVRFGTVGKPIPGVEIRIADDGEVLARGPNVMIGYYNQPEATAEAIDGDGWFHTGDIGEFDADGYLRITDRKKDIIVTAGGKNVAPQNIENMLKMQKFVEQACVIGDRRKYLTALIVPAFEELTEWAIENGIPSGTPAELVARPEVHALIQKAIDNVNGQLARYETIKKFLPLADEFTVDNNMLTPSMKVRRKNVMKRYAEDIEGLYAEV